MKTSTALLVGCCFVGSVVLTMGQAGGLRESVSPSPDAQRLIGTWQLVSFESTDQETQRVRGTKPIGLLVYDSTGQMAAQIMPDRNRRRFTGPVSGVFAGPRPTAEEALDAITGYAAYFGTYVVDDRTRTVTHRRLGNLNPGALGDFPRRYAFAAGDRLVLSPLDNPDLRTAQLTWERVK
jgi:hypothetical protein